MTSASSRADRTSIEVEGSCIVAHVSYGHDGELRTSRGLMV
jgi:hypothetical protein